MSEKFAAEIIEQAVKIGATTFCLCPGARNYHLAALLLNEERVDTYCCIDERAAGFFALGRSKETRRPAVVITTSGTAAGELLPAAMEGYYAGIPLMLITADRPRSYRQTGAPQTAEQVNIFGQYAPFALDLAEGESFQLKEWNQAFPAHLNVCFEEADTFESSYQLKLKTPFPHPPKLQFSLDGAWQVKRENIFLDEEGYRPLRHFLDQTHNPLIVVGTLKDEFRDAVCEFILNVQVPAYFEASSGLREDPRLSDWRITRSDQLWKRSKEAGYPLDGILRIGGVPTFRLWRDLEDKGGEIKAFSVNDVPFTGISWGKMAYASLDKFFTNFKDYKKFNRKNAEKWLEQDNIYNRHLHQLMEEFPLAETSLYHKLSQIIPENSLVYIGNSLPIRQWDLAGTWEDRGCSIYSSRGLNGIDGQFATFLGMAKESHSNWAILGDLTTMYDMNSLWLVPQLHDRNICLVVVNNHGGKIFARKFPDPAFQNRHTFDFAHLAGFWGLDYQKWEDIPKKLSISSKTLIEICPDENSTEIFWGRLAKI